jgi:hypothetical protein
MHNKEGATATHQPRVGRDTTIKSFKTDILTQIA